jgi:hypothetical protein
MLKEKEVTEDAPVKTVSGVNHEEAVDADVTKIVKEKIFAFDGFDDTGVIRDGASNDVKEGERVEV